MQNIKFTGPRSVVN